MELVREAKVITPPEIDYAGRGIVMHADIPYDARYPRCLMNVMVPAAGDGPFPVIVWIHGGGWNSEDLTRKYMPSEFLAEMNEDGYVVASIDYRLSMDAPFPAHIEDCKAAIRFLRAHAAEYKIDKENFSVIGESAGGHLSALVAMSRDDEFIDEVFPEESSAVKSAVVWYGPADMRSRGTDDGPLSLLFAYEDADVRRQMQVLASPVLYAARKNPPLLLMHGNRDGLVPIENSCAMYDALKAFGNDVEFIVVDGQWHGFFDGQEYYDAIHKFFDRTLR